MYGGGEDSTSTIEKMKPCEDRRGDGAQIVGEVRVLR